MKEDKIKIAFLSVFHPFRGGISQFNTELFKALDKKSEIKAFNFTTQYPNFLFPGKSQYVNENDVSPEFSSTSLLSSVNPFSFRKTANEIKIFNPDIVITSYWMPFFGPALGSVCKKLKKNSINISIVHNAIPHEKRLGDKLLSKYYFKQQHGFVTMSKTVKSDLKNLMSSPKTMLRPHPLYAQFGESKPKDALRKAFGVKKNQKVLLFFGFIRKYKGLDLLLEALKDCDENTVVLIAGECYGDFTEYEKIIIDSKIEERVINRVQYIPDAEVADMFTVSDVCVLPYRSATQSGIASIAKYYQIPMVVTPVGELPNEVIHGKTGVVCETFNPIHIAQGINLCIDSIGSISENLKSEKEEHNWDNFASELLNFVQRIVID